MRAESGEWRTLATALGSTESGNERAWASPYRDGEPEARRLGVSSVATQTGAPVARSVIPCTPVSRRQKIKSALGRPVLGQTAPIQPPSRQTAAGVLHFFVQITPSSVHRPPYSVLRSSNLHFDVFRLASYAGTFPLRNRHVSAGEPMRPRRDIRRPFIAILFLHSVVTTSKFANPPLCDARRSRCRQST